MPKTLIDPRVNVFDERIREWSEYMLLLARLDRVGIDTAAVFPSLEARAKKKEKP
jgi:hypothetical protein